MIHGFIKVAAATPQIRVADCQYNVQQMVMKMAVAQQQHVKLLVFPELCITGYTCGDLFLQKRLQDGATAALLQLAAASVDFDGLVVVGVPLTCKGKLFNCAAVLYHGDILGVVPKTHVPNYAEFYEKRHFASAPAHNGTIAIGGNSYPFGTHLLFRCSEVPEFCLGVEICEDLWAPVAPSVSHAVAGATIIANCSASDETIGKDHYRRELIRSQSARLLCGYLYSDAGEGESTTDLVFAGHNLIGENGVILNESALFQNSMVVTEIDVQRLDLERKKNTTFPPYEEDGYEIISFRMQPEETTLTRYIAPLPFIPADQADRESRCEDILSIQSMGLKKRIAHSHAKTAVIGISGGLDSCLALLVAARAMDLLGRPRTDVIAVTMPCFGTTARTKGNAEQLSELLGVDLRHVDIKAAVELHFADIGQDAQLHDVTYENSQARERTQILMDIANRTGGLVVGTGDLSELALGWATYNGDHMSMYGVNASIPKTLIRHIVKYVADHTAVTCTDADGLKHVLYDILDTPVSPELLPPSDGEIAQKTEDIVGPYELHDFYLYYAIRWGFNPRKVYRLARLAFYGVYDEETLKKWLHNFYRRFFAQQFKRSCVPDGPKVGSVSLSPRGDWRMPSDACYDLWKIELDQL